MSLRAFDKLQVWEAFRLVVFQVSGRRLFQRGNDRLEPRLFPLTDPLGGEKHPANTGGGRFGPPVSGSSSVFIHASDSGLSKT